MANRRDDDDRDGTGADERRPRQASLLFGVAPAPPSRTYDCGHAPPPKLEPPAPKQEPRRAGPGPVATTFESDEPRWRVRKREAERSLETDAQVRWGDAWRSMLRAEHWVLDFADGEALRLRRSVRQLSMHAGVVESTLVDGRGKPHRVQLRLPVFAESDWARLARHVVEQGGRDAVTSAAKTKAVAFPLVEGADACGLGFLPRRLTMLAAACTCGGARTPCDHVTGTHLALAKAFDEDPWQLIAIRGATPATLDEWMERAQELVATHAADAVDPSAGNAWDFEPAPYDLSHFARDVSKRPPLPPPDGWKARESFDAMCRRLLARAGGPA